MSSVGDKPKTQHSPPEMQFSLRALLVFVAAVAGLFAVIIYASTLVSAIVIWFVLLVFCHVAANAWGSRSGRRTILDDGEGPPQGAMRRGGDPLAANDPANDRVAAHSALDHSNSVRSRLSRKQPLSRWLYLPVPAGALMGSYAGVVMLFGRLADVPTWRTLTVTGISSAAIGGFLAFLISSFLGVALHALLEAQR